MPAVDKQTILITGASDGLGRAVARELAALGATVLLHARDRRRGEEALAAVRADTANDRLRLLLADLASLEELRGRDVTATCLHPATYMPTKMVQAAGVDPISSLEEGVQATLRLIVDPRLAEVSGRYFNGQTPAEPHPQARDPDARRRLREL